MATNIDRSLNVKDYNVYKDVVSYKLAENVTEERLLEVATNLLTNWMSKQSGFVKWEIHREDNGDYTDIVYWESKDAAKEAEEDMKNIPNSGDWFSCYELSSIATKHLHHLATFD